MFCVICVTSKIRLLNRLYAYLTVQRRQGTLPSKNINFLAFNTSQQTLLLILLKIALIYLSDFYETFKKKVEKHFRLQFQMGTLRDCLLTIARGCL